MVKSKYPNTVIKSRLVQLYFNLQFLIVKIMANIHKILFILYLKYINAYENKVTYNNIC